MLDRRLLVSLSLALFATLSANDIASAKTARSFPSEGDLKTQSSNKQQSKEKPSISESDKTAEKEVRQIIEDIKARIRAGDHSHHDLENKLRSYPSFAVKLILDAMDTNDDAIRVPMAQALGRVASYEDYYFSNDSIKTIIAILKACPQRDVKSSMLNILGSIGPRNDDIKAAIVYSLRNSQEPVVKRAALEALAHLSQQEKPSLHLETTKILLSELANEDAPSIRSTAASALSRYLANAEVVVPALIKAMDDNYLTVRNSACQALSAYQGAAKPAVPKLIEILKTETDSSIRYSALSTLQNIDRTDPQILSIYLELLDDPTMGRNTISYLSNFGPAAAPAVPKLIALLKNGDIHTKHQVANALSNIGPAAKEALPALSEALKENDRTLVRYAEQAINRINQTTE